MIKGDEMTDNKLLEALKEKFGDATFSRNDVKEVAEELGLKSPRWFLEDPKYKVKRGTYRVIDSFQPKKKNPVQENISVQNIHAAEARENLVPDVDPLFVKFGPYEDVSKIIGSGIFYPLFITGLSGNGKTFSVEQSCAEHNRELFRVNITIETDEDDLLGGFRLVNDSTKWFDGPVIRAMKSGAVLLLDEVDLGSTKLLCLQPILEGKGILLKKINQYVKPAPGFTIIATANTKGQGSETGKFIGTNVLNEAFLERFPVTFEQRYPEETVERTILKRVFDRHEVDSEDSENFIDCLVKWAFATRKAFEEDASSDLISTRRLVHIAQAFSVLGERRKAIELCINRFDETTKFAFIQLYEKFDASVCPQADERSVEDLDLDTGNNDILDILSNS